MTHTGKVHKYWNQWYHIIEEDAPELLDEFIGIQQKGMGFPDHILKRSS